MNEIPSDTPPHVIDEDSLWKLHGLLYWLYQSLRVQEGEECEDLAPIMGICEAVEREIRKKITLE